VILAIYPAGAILSSAPASQRQHLSEAALSQRKAKAYVYARQNSDRSCSICLRNSGNPHEAATAVDQKKTTSTAAVSSAAHLRVSSSSTQAATFAFIISISCSSI
jgi:hypothetical protein